MQTTGITIPKKELQGRIKKLQTHLGTQNIDAALILQNTDLYYFTGTIQHAFLYIPADGEPLLMVRKDVDRATAESKIDHIVPIESPKKIPELLKTNGYQMPKTLGLECDVLPANFYLFCQNIFNRAVIKDISHPIRLVRAVKSPYEIGMTQEASALAGKMAGSVKDILYEGMTEVELAGKVEAVARKLGHQGIVRMRLWGGEMFYGHLMSGPAAATPSYLSSPTGGDGLSPAVAQSSSFRKINAYEPVLVDYVFAHQGYLADQTRIFALKGLSEHLISAHQAMLDLQALLKQAAIPGVKAGSLYETALEFVKSCGYEDHFMGVGPQRIQFVGHGIGLEIDEYPFLAKGQDLSLQHGMVVALEPKLIFPGEGVVGIENTHVVTDEGLAQLTKFPDEIIIV